MGALRVGNTRTAAVHAAEISLETLRRWMDDDAEFRGAIQKAEADAEQRFLAQVAVAAKTTWQAAAWWLERRRAMDYRQRSGVELTGADGGPIESRDVTHDLNDHERELLGAAIRGELARRSDPGAEGDGVGVPATTGTDPTDG